MILTEEQRAAIHAMSGLLTAIGCPQCHSYLQKNYTHHIEVLRAMTDSSEHFSDATKMIGFDMEKARASIAHYRIENPSNVDTESALKELVDQANLAEDALAEIERLQGFETAARDLNNDLIRIAGERDELAARIQELEDAHKRSGVKYTKIINELRSSVYANMPGLKKQWDEILNAPANGKIGPDARPKCDHAWQAAIEERGYQTCLKCGECRNIEDIPRTAPAWQITDERKAAIRRAMEFVIFADSDSEEQESEDVYAWRVLQAMLTEADHDKP